METTEQQGDDESNKPIQTSAPPFLSSFHQSIIYYPSMKIIS